MSGLSALDSQVLKEPEKPRLVTGGGNKDKTRGFMSELGNDSTGHRGWGRMDYRKLVVCPFPLLLSSPTKPAGQGHMEGHREEKPWL